MTLPNYNRGSGFYDPGKSYLSRAGTPPLQAEPGFMDPYGTNDNPEGYFQQYAVNQGFGGLGSRARTAQGLYGQAQRGFAAAQAGSNVNLFFPEYLDQLEFSKLVNNLSYEGQGLDPSRYQGRYRWQTRGS
jgi:hypothetical protein